MNEEQPITLVLPYHPALQKHIYEIIKTAHEAVHKSPKLSQILQKPPRITYRNAKSIRRSVVRARLKPLGVKERGVFKCNRPRCQIDAVLHLGDKFTNFDGSQTFEINHRLSCNSENVIYLLTCNGCGKKYVGSTITAFNLRFNQYKSNINLYGKGRRGFKQEKLISHFFTEGHTGSYKDISVQIIDFCDPNKQEEREDFWITTLNTRVPYGLNIRKCDV